MPRPVHMLKAPLTPALNLMSAGGARFLRRIDLEIWSHVPGDWKVDSLSARRNCQCRGCLRWLTRQIAWESDSSAESLREIPIKGILEFVLPWYRGLGLRELQGGCSNGEEGLGRGWRTEMEEVEA